jgi:hypothetical protein
MAENPEGKQPAMPANAVRPMSPEEIRQAEVATQNAIAAEVKERDATNGPEGGRYMVGDQMVDANGEPVKDKKG